MPDFKAKEHLKVTNLIFTSMLGGLFIYAMIALFITYGKKEPVNTADAYRYIAVAIAFIAYIIGYLVSNTIVTNGIKRKELQSKMNAYRSSIILKISLLEIASIYAISTYIATADLLLLVVAAVMVFSFRFFRPTPIRLAKIMKLTRKEASALM